MLVYTASLGMAVFQVEQAMNAVQDVGRQVGGYLSSRGDAAITIRVPRDRFEDALRRVERLGDINHREVKAEDVTDKYVDIEARLKNAMAMRDRLLALLQKANVTEAIAIEKDLGRMTEEIERLQGELKLLGSQIAFATISVNFEARAAESVHDASLLAPFPWLAELGLQTLLNVHP
ncbi:MAG: DUF4349 domain-containing protein [Polyangiaceae bacterium]|jgi:hypothetical protein